MSINWVSLYKKYKSLWVALEDDEKTVVASGKTAKEAWTKAQKKGSKNPILSRIPSRIVTYVGSNA